MRRGFTLLEVVVAILVLEIGVLAVLGTLTVASRNLTRAARLERAVATTESVLDSLTGTSAPADGALNVPGGHVEWTVGPDGVMALNALDLHGATLFSVATVLPRP